jgi:hypothetical protein
MLITLFLLATRPENRIAAVNAAYKSCHLKSIIGFISLLNLMSHVTEHQAGCSRALQWSAEIVIFSETDETSSDNLLTLICALCQLDCMTEDLLFFTIRPTFSDMYLRRLSTYISWLAYDVTTRKGGYKKSSDGTTVGIKETDHVRTDMNGEAEDAIMQLCNGLLPHRISYVFLLLFNI